MARRKRDDIVHLQEDDESAVLGMPGVANISMREETWPEIIFPAVRYAVLYVLGLALALLAIYAIFASSLLFRATVDNSVVFVARTTYQGGVPTLKSDAYVSTQADDGTFLSNLKVGFQGAPNASVYKIYSGPYDKVRFIGTSVYVNSALVGRQAQALPAAQTTTLSNQYLGQCVSGACTHNGKQWSIIPAANIYGEVRSGR